ncbi:hypothetical protein [Streptomyces flavofungini]|uniref:hypothetical protein n=1 Tax=Streptomyces flavofungini TaxID=68200 RepID=UPI0034DE3C46
MSEVWRGVTQEVGAGPGAVGVVVQMQRGVLLQQELLALRRGEVVLVELPGPQRARRVGDQDTQVGAVDADAPGREVRAVEEGMAQEFHPVRGGRQAHAFHPAAPTPPAPPGFFRAA